MKVLRLAMGVAALSAALLGGSANASVVCVDEPVTDPVYQGCTWIDTTRPCVYGGGEILGGPYRIICWT